MTEEKRAEAIAVRAKLREAANRMPRPTELVLSQEEQALVIEYANDESERTFASGKALREYFGHPEPVVDKLKAPIAFRGIPVVVR